MPPSVTEDHTYLVPAQFRPSRWRWYILFLTGFMGMVQSLIWMGKT